jgi:HD-GYP domain-containing protein (c-di-GMP phosphodiesterase class II)
VARELFKKRVSVDHLEVGMYVTELDRPWLESPFLLQGFMLQDESDIEEVQRVCKFVYIDAERGLDIAPHLVISDSDLEKIQAEDDGSNLSDGHRVPLEKEINKASEIRQRTRAVIDMLYDEASKGDPISVEEAKQVVDQLIDSIMRNSDAQMLLTQLKKKDEYTAIHSLNVCILALTFGRHMELKKNDLQELGLGALMHDLGKMKIPNEILNKPSRLTPEEFKLMMTHPAEGRKLLIDAPHEIPERSIEVAYTHHEQYDGNGYPEGLDGDSIPYFGRMVTIVDYYDAVTSDRVYHDGASTDEAVKYMYSFRNNRFDGDLVEHFIQCLGVYPLGSIVELSNKEIGVVVSINKKRKLKPKLLLVADKNRKHYPAPKLIDLAQFEGNKQYDIHRVIPTSEVSIDVRKYLHDLAWAS